MFKAFVLIIALLGVSCQAAYGNLYVYYLGQTSFFDPIRKFTITNTSFQEVIDRLPVLVNDDSYRQNDVGTVSLGGGHIIIEKRGIKVFSTPGPINRTDSAEFRLGFSDGLNKIHLSNRKALPRPFTVVLDAPLDLWETVTIQQPGQPKLSFNYGELIRNVNVNLRNRLLAAGAEVIQFRPDLEVSRDNITKIAQSHEIGFFIGIQFDIRGRAHSEIHGGDVELVYQPKQRGTIKCFVPGCFTTISGIGSDFSDESSRARFLYAIESNDHSTSCRIAKSIAAEVSSKLDIPLCVFSKKDRPYQGRARPVFEGASLWLQEIGYSFGIPVPSVLSSNLSVFDFLSPSVMVYPELESLYREWLFAGDDSNQTLLMNRWATRLSDAIFHGFMNGAGVSAKR
jgi:hypothetical protein